MSKFTFAQRSEGFDNHIEQSIRGYNNLINDVISISEYFIEDDSTIIDIGCSTGKMLKSIIDNSKKFINTANFVGIELEDNFYSEYEIDELKYNNLKYYKGNVNDYVFFCNCSYITSIFSLQFMTMKNRQTIINKIFNSLSIGGAFVFAEKTISSSPKIHEIKTFTYYDYKRNVFETDDILNKEKELRHLMKPNTHDELINMCINAGFKLENIDTFWQNHSFKAYIAIK